MKDKKEAIVLALLLTIISLCIYLLLPFKAQTAGDDYFYAYSVKKSLETSKIQISEASTASQVFSIFWASLFSNLLGFSYKTLHISTVAFLPIATVSTYYLLKQFSVSSKKAFFASLFFISIPYFFQYSLTFLTDFPFLTLELLSLLFLVKGLKTDSVRVLIAGSLFSSLAFLTRQLGIFLPLSAAAGYLIASKNVSVPKKLSRILAITLMPALTLLVYTAVFREGTVSQYNMNRAVVQTINSLLFLKSPRAAQETWLQTIHVDIEFIWQALGFFSLFALAFIISNLKRYLKKQSLKPLLISLGAFAFIVLLEKVIYMDKTYLGFPLVLYRYESLLPIPWPHIWKFMVMISFIFLSTETILNLKNLKITRTAIFLSISFLIIFGLTSIAGPAHKKYVIPLLPYLLIYICFLSSKLRISALVALPILLFVLVDSLQMAKLRYDTNALAQQKALELVTHGVKIDRILPNLEHTWSLWYTIEDKYEQELQKVGGDKLKVKYPVTPDNQDYLIISKENLRYGNLPQNYVFIEKTAFNSLFVSSYLLTVKKL